MADHSTDISSSMSSNYMAQTQQPMSEEVKSHIEEQGERIRRAYEAVFQHQMNPRTPALWWRDQFLTAARQTIATIEEMTGSSDESLTLSVALGQSWTDPPIPGRPPGQIFSFNSRDQSTILLGRFPGCTLRFPESNQTSRLHALIFLLPAQRQFVVVDVGSLSGIKTIRRSAPGELISTEPNHRPLLIFSMEEIVVLQMGIQKVVINPKECVVCLERAREVTFPCSHYVACSQCAEQLTSCPLCRADVNVGQMGSGPDFKLNTCDK